MNGVTLRTSTDAYRIAPQRTGAAEVRFPNAEQVVQHITKINAKNRENIEKIQRVSDIILGRKTKFSVDNESGDLIVSIIDPKTNQVIKEIPSAEEQKMRAKLKRMAEISFRGSIIDIRA